MNNWTVRFNQWQAFAQSVNARAERTRALIVADARRTAARAGLDPSIPFLHAHNAVVSADYGRPWPEVNLSLARRVLWLERRSWEPGRIADAVINRAYARLVREDR